jgi:hypothetical protein
LQIDKKNNYKKRKSIEIEVFATYLSDIKYQIQHREHKHKVQHRTRQLINPKYSMFQIQLKIIHLLESLSIKAMALFYYKRFVKVPWQRHKHIYKICDGHKYHGSSFVVARVCAGKYDYLQTLEPKPNRQFINKPNYVFYYAKVSFEHFKFPIM